MWSARYALEPEKPIRKQEVLTRQDSVRLVSTFDASSRNISLSRTNTDAIIETAGGGSRARKSAKKRKRKSNSKKRKEGLIVVKQFVLYALFLVCAADLFFYQGFMESPSFCLPDQNASALPGEPYACYVPLPASLDSTTALTDGAGGVNTANVYGYPEYALEYRSTLFYVRGNHPHENRVLHLLVPLAAALLSLFYAVWRFLRHNQCVKLGGGTKVAGAFVGFLLPLVLSIGSIVSLASLDPATRAQWLRDLEVVSGHLDAMASAGSEAFAAADTRWNATLPREEVVANTTGTVLAYSSHNASATAAGTAATASAAAVFRATTDFTDSAAVTQYCKAVCGLDADCVGFYLREYSVLLSVCDDVYFCDFYHSLELAGPYDADADSALGVAGDANSGGYTLFTEVEVILAQQAAYARDPANPQATSELGSTGSQQAAEGFCDMLDGAPSVDPLIVNHGINATNITLYRVLDRGAYEAEAQAKADFLELMFNDTGTASVVARVWHEQMVADCKAAVAEGAGAVTGISLADFLAYDATATTSSAAVLPGLNVTSLECWDMVHVADYASTMLFAAADSFPGVVQPAHGSEDADYTFIMGSSVLQMLTIVLLVLLLVTMFLSGITVATRLITLVTRLERCTNCEMAYTLKQQPLQCASCGDVFCQFCLVYSVAGQKFGLFSSEVRGGKDDAKNKKDKLVCMDCFSQSFDKSVELLLQYSLGQNDLATGFLNYVLTVFVTELETGTTATDRSRQHAHGGGGRRHARMQVDPRVHDGTDIAVEEGVGTKVALQPKSVVVKKLKSVLRRSFGDMLDFREDFMKETEDVFETVYNFAKALSERGSTVTLEDFHKQTRKFPRSSFTDVFLDKYDMDIEHALATLESSRKVKHLGKFRAMFEEIIDFARNTEDPDPDAKPMLLANSHRFDESLKSKFRKPTEPLFRSETAVSKPSPAVLGFAKKFWELSPVQQDLFHEQLLWHSRAADTSFQECKATVTAMHGVFVVMCRPFGSTQPPGVYHMYMLEDFIAFFRAPPGFDDEELVVDRSVMTEGPSNQPMSAHRQASTEALFEDFCEAQEARLHVNPAGDGGAGGGGGGAKAAEAEQKGGGGETKARDGAATRKGGGGGRRRVSLHDLEFILTRSDVPYLSKKSSSGGEFGGGSGPGGGGAAAAEVAPEGSAKVQLHSYTRGKTQIVLKGIYSHVLECVIAKAPNAELGAARLPKLASLQTNRLFTQLLAWQSLLPTANALGILRFESSYPPRDEGGCKMYLNGMSYFRDVVECIGAARYSVMIADWCMSPRIYLRRESGPMQTFRLDLLLQRKARQGVQIFVLLYKDIAIGLGSDYTEDFLVKLHANIHVVRHNCLKSTISDKFDKIYYSHHQKCVVVDNGAAFVGGIDLCYGRFETPAYPLKDLEGKWFPGHSFKNPQLELPGGDGKSHINEPFLTPVQMNRHRHWRMPWNDVHSVVTGKAAADVALMLVQRWQVHNHTNGNKSPMPVWPGPLLRNWGLDGLWQAGSVQLLRSMACWSGNEMVETSIYRCYLEMIRTAKHSIYIENQFFISAIEGNNTVHNRICQALFDRIMVAIHKHQEFRVIIVVPFHADGPLHSQMAMSVLHYLRASVAFTPTSLLHSLARECGKIKDRAINLEDYIVFLSLAQWGEVAYEHHDNGFSKGGNKTIQYGLQPVYTQVYTHSKLMVVDDWCLIVGSANINDRSMLGDRDSEMAVYIEDREFINVQMGSSEVTVGKNIHRFRMQLMNKILSQEYDNENTSNVVSDDVYREFLLATAKNNTEAFHLVFPEFPHSSYLSMKQYDAAVAKHEEDLKKMDPAVRSELDERHIKLLKARVKGLVCQFPLKFLELDPTLISSQNLKAQIADVVSGGRFFT